ncbi:hypothetical protein G5I_04283 [Acromyrmex echinatior]|uniref:Uncharacterized protein n=1 Tax=Acromyrmex echinatior TaxID=103372 RepID=F4WF76_ACREC|nr:hypothetical protein G5I_04283 [Acromyrmex echinatior]
MGDARGGETVQSVAIATYRHWTPFTPHFTYVLSPCTVIRRPDNIAASTGPYGQCVTRCRNSHGFADDDGTAMKTTVVEKRSDSDCSPGPRESEKQKSIEEYGGAGGRRREKEGSGRSEGVREVEPSLRKLRLPPTIAVRRVSNEFGGARIVSSMRPCRARTFGKRETARPVSLFHTRLAPADPCPPPSTSTNGDSVASLHDRDLPRRTADSPVAIVLLETRSGALTRPSSPVETRRRGFLVSGRDSSPSGPRWRGRYGGGSGGGGGVGGVGVGNVRREGGYGSANVVHKTVVNRKIAQNLESFDDC